MKQIYSLTSIPSDTNFIAGIDVIGNIKKLFAIPAQIPGCLFLLCIRGQCDITIHINKYKLKKNSIAIVYPDQFVQIAENTPDCRFAFVGFSSTLIQHPFLFSNTIQYAPSILEEPVIELEPKTAEVFRDYFKMLIKAKHQNNTLVREEQLPLILTGLIIELGNINKQEPVKKEGQPYTRSQEIVKELIRIVVENYKTERNISFYADKMHLSPQHLSTTVTDRHHIGIRHQRRASQAEVHRTNYPRDSLLAELPRHFFLREILQALHRHVAQAIPEYGVTFSPQRTQSTTEEIIKAQCVSVAKFQPSLPLSISLYHGISYAKIHLIYWQA